MKTDWPATSHYPAVYSGLSPECLIKGEVRAQPQAALLLSRHTSCGSSKGNKNASVTVHVPDPLPNQEWSLRSQHLPQIKEHWERQEESGLGGAEDQRRLLPGPALSPVKGQVCRPQAAMGRPQGR